MTNRRGQNGLTLIELLVVIVVIGVLVGLLLPATRSSREAARRMSCSGQFKQAAVALHNYHSVHKQLPMQMGGTFNPSSNRGSSSPPGNNRYRLSFLVAVMPYMEQQALWEAINDDPTYAPMGPAPWTREFSPWQTDIPTLRCPSDPGQGLPAHGRTNIAACLGDATHRIETGPVRWNKSVGAWTDDRKEQVAVSGRGVFVPRTVTRFRDVLDGLSNTIMAGEIATDLEDNDARTSASVMNPWSAIHDTPTLCESQLDSDRPSFWSMTTRDCPDCFGQPDQKRGFRWADGAALYTGFNTILPPNRESCLAGGAAGIGMLSASSRHQGGVHIMMGDGAVIFITDSIDCGDQSIGTVIHDGTGPRAPGSQSPYGLWGALGTRNLDETIEEQLNQ